MAHKFLLCAVPVFELLRVIIVWKTQKYFEQIPALTPYKYSI